MEIKKEQINYITYLFADIKTSLENLNKEYTKDDYIFASTNRAKFDKLRILLNQELLDIKKQIYK